VGRGTPTPFEHFGAPYIDAEKLTAYLMARKIDGVTFTAAHFPVAEDSNHYPYHGQTIPGVNVILVDRTKLDVPELGVELLSALHHLYPQQFNMARASRLVANAATMQALNNNEDPRDIAAGWQKDLDAYKHRREPYLLYH
jgi:uncharacterized protein YbbC (DUF1343 family)